MNKPECRQCEYHKEEWKETTEKGKPVVYLARVYCTEKECQHRQAEQEET